VNLGQDKAEVHIRYGGGGVRLNVRLQTKGEKFLTSGHFLISIVR
jgi:hypothetical protein